MTTVTSRPTLSSLKPGVPRGEQITALVEGANFRIADLAEVSGLSDQTIRNWKAEGESSERLPDILDDIRTITDLVVRRGELRLEQVGPWFGQRNRGLVSYRRPLDAIKDPGGFESVLAAAENAEE